MSFAWRSAPTAIRSTPAGRSSLTRADVWSASSAGWPRAACTLPRLGPRNRFMAARPPGGIAQPAPGERADAEPGREAPGPALEPSSDGYLSAGRDAPVGGQAVLEGVMMRGVQNWAVAVRKPLPEPEQAEGSDANGAVRAAGDGAASLERSTQGPGEGEIEVRTFPLRSALRRHRVLRLPVLRGVV